MVPHEPPSPFPTYSLLSTRLYTVREGDLEPLPYNWERLIEEVPDPPRIQGSWIYSHRAGVVTPTLPAVLRARLRHIAWVDGGVLLLYLCREVTVTAAAQLCLPTPPVFAREASTVGLSSTRTASFL
jgi:hypothetical protein